jgi:hypothetical protein
MNYQEEHELLLGQTALPNLYDYSNAIPCAVHQMKFEDGILVSCQIIIPEVKPELYEDTF